MANLSVGPIFTKFSLLTDFFTGKVLVKEKDSIVLALVILNPVLKLLIPFFGRNLINGSIWLFIFVNKE
jgi:hypothetical protein